MKRIEDEKKEEEDSNDEEDEEEEEDEESEAPVVKGQMKKDTKSTIQNRRMVKGQRASLGPQRQSSRSKSAVKSAGNSSIVNVKSAKAAASKSVKKVIKVVDEDESENLEMTEREEEESVPEVQMINTQSKQRGGARKPASKQRASSLPKVGSKRVRKSAKKSLDEEDEEKEEPSALEGGDEEEESSQPVKKRKIGGGKAEKAPKGRKPPKKPTEYKKGKWNPEVEVLKLDKYLEHPQNELFIECCIRCNNRNIIRAAYTGNDKLLKAGI